MTIEEPKGHDAAVIRCSSCGAPRQDGSESCGFCHSDFTLHEQDLQTVCPKCLARVSSLAKYCHHCATPLVPEMAAGDETPLICPACPDEQRLTSRRMGEEKITVLECGKCTGLWLSNDSFTQLADRVSSEAAAREHMDTERPKAAKAAEQSGPLYRKCVQCRKMMQRRQYAHGSGVIIDICRHHGVWFDANELPQIVRWIRKGGNRGQLKAMEKTSDSRAARGESSRMPARMSRGAWSHDAGAHDAGADDAVLDVMAGAAIRVLGRLFW